MHSPSLSLRFAAREWIRIDLLKAIQAALLTELPREGVLEFWARHPLTVFKGHLPPKPFFRYLWESGGKVPPTYFWSVIGDLEEFLEGKGLRPDRIFHLINHGPGGGPPLDPGWVLANLPAPEGGNEPTDLRALLLAGLPVLARRLFPGCRMERIRPMAAVAEGLVPACSDLFAFQPLAGTRDLRLPDFRLFPGMLFQALPRLFGWSAFDRLEVVADMRGPAASLGRSEDEGWNWKGDMLRHGNRRMGRLEPLDMAIDDWPEAEEVRSALEGLARVPVLRMEQDFKPRGLNRGRLRGGCLYGSPLFLARIGYAAHPRWERLAAWLRRTRPAVPEPRPAWEVAERLQRELLDSLD